MSPLPPSFVADPDPPGTRFLTVFEKLRSGMTKNLLTETDTILKAVSDNIVKNFGLGEDASLRKGLKQIVLYFSTLLSPAEYARTKELAKILILFLTKVAEFEDVKCILRDEYGVLKFLAPIVKHEANQDDHQKLMTLIEILTREMTITWKIPYMVDLINHSVEQLLERPDGIPITLQFLINVCRRNHCCVLILRSSAKYKPAWKVLNARFINSTDVRIHILVSHLNYLAEVCIPVKTFKSDYDLATLAMEEALEDQDRVSDRFCHLLETVRQMMESICEKMKFVLLENPTTSISHGGTSREQAENIVAAKNNFLELLTKFQEDMAQYVKTHGVDKFSHQAQISILSMVSICLLPYNATITSDPTLIKNCKAAAETTCQILLKSDDMLQIHQQAFGVILRISELIFEGKDSTAKAVVVDFISRFKSVIKIRALCTDSPMIGLKLDTNIILVRLYGALLFEPTVRETVKKLSGKTVRDLFLNTVRDTVDRKQRYRQSVFAVELMTLLCRFSEVPEIFGMLLEQLTVPEIVNHISNCIRNGDEKEIAKALYLITSVAFNRSCVWAAAKSLKQAQDQLINITEAPVDVIPSYANSWSPPRSDIETMDYIVDNQKDPSTSAISDVLSWCQLRREVHQHEIGMLNSHIFQLNRTISNLNILLEKQSNFVSKHMAENEQRDLELSTLQHRYENAVKESEAKFKLLEEDALKLREENTSLIEKNKAQSEKITNMEQEISTLQTGRKALEESKANLTELLKQAKGEKKGLREELRKAKSQSDTASSKIEQLEKDLEKKSNDFEHLQQSLTKKQKMIDAIQGIVGKNFANFDM